MSLLAPLPAYFQIEDRLDAIGQKYRVQRILRGAMLWVVALLAASFAAALLAHLLGHGAATRLILGALAAWALFSTWRWLVRPLLIRPDNVEVARFIESRVEGLHNGLTNGLLLSRRTDLAQSPWLPEIYNEIAANTMAKPLAGAVKLRDLTPLVLRLAAIAVPLIVIACVFPKPFFHGWNQLLSPTAFVPRIGMAEIVEVQPGNVTVVAGQPLEVTLIARCPGLPKAQLFFERGAGVEASAVVPQTAELVGSSLVETEPRSDSRSRLQYNYRLDHVDASFRYRVEVAGTQSQWYAVTVVRQIKLEQLEFHIVPPSYTRQEIQTVTVNAADVAKTNLTVPQGSRVELSARVDVAVGGAMLDTGLPQPVSMDTTAGGRRFSTALTIMDETPIAILLNQGGKQIVAKLPEESFVIHCLKDQPPTIEMKWPTQDSAIAPEAELKLHALLHDDYGVASIRVLMLADAGGAAPTTLPTTLPTALPAAAGEGDEKNAGQLAVVHEESLPPGIGVKEAQDFSFILPVKPEVRKHGNSIRVQLEIADNRDLRGTVAATAGHGSRR